MAMLLLCDNVTVVFMAVVFAFIFFTSKKIYLSKQ